MTRALLAFLALLAVAAPACAATCGQGMKVVGELSRTLDLTDAEQTNIQAIMEKAKREELRGHERDCKLILADAIRFFLIKTVLD